LIPAIFHSNNREELLIIIPQSLTPPIRIKKEPIRARPARKKSPSPPALPNKSPDLMVSAIVESRTFLDRKDFEICKKEQTPEAACPLFQSNEPARLSATGQIPHAWRSS